MKQLLTKTYKGWSEAKASRLAAALAYYTLFSLAPLMLLIFSIIGLFTSDLNVQQSLLTQVRNTMGSSAGDAVAQIVAASRSSQQGLLATIFGLLMMIYGGVSMVAQLQESLNVLWGVQFNKEGLDWQSKLWRKTRALLVALGGGFLLLLSHLATSAVSLLEKYMPSFLGLEGVWQLAPQVVTFLLTAAVFAMLFRFLPDAEIDWKDVLVGALGTALLFTVGRVLLTLYFEYAAPSSSYGAAGSLVALLLFVYWSAQILFFGAQFTKEYALYRGKTIRPMEGAEINNVNPSGWQLSPA